MEYEEYVRYEPQLARRAFAAMLDYGVYFLVFFAYVKFFGEPNENGQYEAKGIHHVLAVMLLWVLYFPCSEGAFGATPFKYLLDLKVKPERRKDYRFTAALKRHLLDPIDFFLFGIVAIVLVKTSSEQKRLGDMFAHTNVVLDKDEMEAPNATSPGAEDPSVKN